MNTEMTNKVIFPIERTIVYHGKDYIRRLDKGDVVSCWYCGEKIPIDEFHVENTSYDVPLVSCRKCRNKVSILYYFDRVVQPEKNLASRKKKKSYYQKTSNRPDYITVK